MDTSILSDPNYQPTAKEIRDAIEGLVSKSFLERDPATPEFLRQMRANAFILAYLGDEYAVAYSALKNHLDPFEASLTYLMAICIVNLSSSTEPPENSKPYSDLAETIAPSIEAFKDRFDAAHFLADVNEYKATRA
jgi:hypothetical protein